MIPQSLVEHIGTPVALIDRSKVKAKVFHHQGSFREITSGRDAAILGNEVVAEVEVTRGRY